MLEVSNIFARRGKATILRDVSCRVDDGEIVAVIGRNGMGKTTLLMSIMGLAYVDCGCIFLHGVSTVGVPPYRIARMGAGYVPEGRGIFTSLSVQENLELCVRSRAQKRQRLDDIYSQFPMLKERRGSSAAALSGGQKQLLAIARALLSSPSLLLIDEFSEGLAPTIVQQISRLLLDVRARGVSVLLVEQNVHVALELADRAYVLENGRVVLDRRAQDLRNDEALLAQFVVV